MKSLSIIFATFFLLQYSMLAQDGWIPQVSETNFNLRSVYFVNQDTGWVVGGDFDTRSGVLLKTTNGGNNWIKDDVDSIQLRAIQFIDENTGWIAGGNYGTSYNTCVSFKTEDGGQNWDTTQLADIYPMPNEIFFISKDTGWMAKSWYFPPDTGYCLFKTTDGGENWFGLNSPPEKYWPIGSIHFVGDTGWLATSHNLSFGGGGKIYKTTDGGDSWQYQFEMTQGSGGRPGKISLSIFFLNSNLGWAVGGGGWLDTLTAETGMYRIIFNTMNGGANWDIQLYDSIKGNNQLDYYALLDARFIDNNNGWAVGEGGNILHTNDGGLNWIDQESGTTETLVSVFFIDSNLGWIVGEDGIILHTTNGGVSFIEEKDIDEIPTDYSLTQNYPNPFNSITTFKYSIPNQSKVIIKVFDVLGHEIETLVNEEKSIGTYELTWYAANLPSGVYFYQLKAGNFTNTKKMVLVR